METIVKKTVPIIEFSDETKQIVSSLNQVWITAKNEKIPVKRMSSLHIRRCIACWKGTGNFYIPDDYLGGKEKWLQIFNNELLTRQ